jgi:peptide/nickel transport system substrate-binding protein
MKRWMVVITVLWLMAALIVSPLAPGQAQAAAPAGGEGHFGLPSGAIDHLDPALSYTAVTWGLEFLTCTPLLTFKDAEGEEGKQIIGGLAGLPEISADGKTYTFTLKPGLKFADGKPITSEDIQYTFERMFSPELASPGAGFFTGIVGAKDFMDGKAKSVSGITIDGDKIKFQLEEPVGSFQARLTMPFSCPVPKGTAKAALENGELQISGPYKVESYDPNRRLVLVRNPNYPAEALGARGKLDRIIVDQTIEPSQAGLLIRANQLDLYLDRLAAADAAQALTDPTLKDRSFKNPQAAVLYLWLNNDVAPFDNVKVRQAVNYALNRNALLRVWGGPSQGAVTDQILPPTMPGWKDVDIYPMGGDVAKAKQLLAESGVTLPIETTMRTRNDAAGYMEVSQAIQEQLKQVGINVKIESAIDSVNNGIIETRANHVPMGLNAWYQDYPDPDDFVDVLLNGDRITPTANQNRADFNNPDINKEMAALSELTGPDRFTRYHALDEKIIRDFAPWAPILNLTQVDVVSDRVTDHVWHPVYGADLAVMGVKQ